LNILNHSYGSYGNFKKIIPLLTNLPNTLIKLDILGRNEYVSLSFLAKFTNLQELTLSIYNHVEYFKDLQHVIFPQLQILKFFLNCPNREYLTKFLKNNGRNLKEIHLCHFNNVLLNLDIANFCSNLKSLYTVFDEDDMETLKVILNNCQQLESLETMCGESGYDYYLNENKLLEIIVKYSPKKFHELKIHYEVYKELFPEELESVFISWANRIPQKSLTLIIIDDLQSVSTVKKDSMEVIEKFEKLGVIKFEFICDDY